MKKFYVDIWKAHFALEDVLGCNISFSDDQEKVLDFLKRRI